MRSKDAAWAFIFTYISGPASTLFAAFVRVFVLVLSRMTVLVLVLVLDCKLQIAKR